MDDRFVRLLAGFLKFLGDEPITADSPLRKLGLDSMDAIELLFAIEDAFGVALPDRAIGDTATFTTAGNLWAAVHAEMTKASPTAGHGSDDDDN